MKKNLLFVSGRKFPVGFCGTYFYSPFPSDNSVNRVLIPVQNKTYSNSFTDKIIVWLKSFVLKEAVIHINVD